MTKKEIKDFACSYNPVMYKYIYDQLYNVKTSKYYSYLYRNKIICPKCEREFIYSNKGICKSDFGDCKCFYCNSSIRYYSLASNVRKDRTIQYIVSYVDLLKNDLAMHRTFCLEYIYSFKKKKMSLKKDLFEIGRDFLDLHKKGNSIYSRMNCIPSGMNYLGYRCFNYGETSIYKFMSESVYDKEFYSFGCISFPKTCIYSNTFKYKYLQYFDLKRIKNDFSPLSLLYFIRVLNYYPKIETLYKYVHFGFGSYSEFFSALMYNMVKGKKKLDFNYELMNEVYKNGYDFTFYKINLKIGKPYIYDRKLLAFLNSHQNYIDRKTIEYLSDQKNFNLYDDYIKMCNKLNIDLSINKNLYPKNLVNRHDEYSALIEKQRNEILSSKFNLLKENYNLLEFEEEGFKFYLPNSSKDFKDRGSILRQCLFSTHFDERYLSNKDIILFIDSVEDLSKENSFTLELDMNLNIVQLHGFSNDINPIGNQLKYRSIVKEIIMNRLKMLSLKKGKIVYKNEYINLKKESLNVMQSV